MKKSFDDPMLKVIRIIGDALSPESAKRILKLGANRKMQTRVDRLARKNSLGTITQDEKWEYREYVYSGMYVAILQAKARTILKTVKNKP